MKEEWHQGGRMEGSVREGGGGGEGGEREKEKKREQPVDSDTIKCVALVTAV